MGELAFWSQFSVKVSGKFIRNLGFLSNSEAPIHAARSLHYEKLAFMRAPIAFSFMPFYSVIIPVFNRADLVSATLDSVMAQSCADWEIIVIDDGSTDGTLDVLQSYRARLGERMQVLQQKHAGPGAARNQGIAAATGTYLAFLDSDDLWFPWTLEFYQMTLQAHDSPSFLVGEPLVFRNLSDWENAQDQNYDRVAQTARVDRFDDYLCADLPTDWLSVSSFVVRRDATRGKAFCARPINGEDIDFTLQMGIEPGFVNVQSPPTFGYRQHAGGITSNYGRTVKGMELLVNSERTGRYPGGRKRQHERLTTLSRHLRPAMLEFLDQGYRRRAWRAFARTLLWHIRLGRVRFLIGFLLRSLQIPRQNRPIHKRK